MLTWETNLLPTGSVKLTMAGRIVPTSSTHQRFPATATGAFSISKKSDSSFCNHQIWSSQEEKMLAVTTPPSREALLSLYHCMLRTSQSFSSYNFRHYFVRRTKETFRNIQVSFWLTLDRGCWRQGAIRRKHAQTELICFTAKPQKSAWSSTDLQSSINCMAAGKSRWRLKGWKRKHETIWGLVLVDVSTLFPHFCCLDHDVQYSCICALLLRIKERAVWARSDDDDIAG